MIVYSLNRVVSTPAVDSVLGPDKISAFEDLERLVFLLRASLINLLTQIQTTNLQNMISDEREFDEYQRIGLNDLQRGIQKLLTQVKAKEVPRESDFVDAMRITLSNIIEDEGRFNENQRSILQILLQNYETLLDDIVPNEPPPRLSTDRKLDLRLKLLELSKFHLWLSKSIFWFGFGPREEQICDHVLASLEHTAQHGLLFLDQQDGPGFKPPLQSMFTYSSETTPPNDRFIYVKDAFIKHFFPVRLLVSARQFMNPTQIDTLISRLHGNVVLKKILEGLEPLKMCTDPGAREELVQRLFNMTTSRRQALGRRIPTSVWRAFKEIIRTTAEADAGNRLSTIKNCINEVTSDTSALRVRVDECWKALDALDEVHAEHTGMGGADDNLVPLWLIRRLSAALQSQDANFLRRFGTLVFSPLGKLLFFSNKATTVSPYTFYVTAVGMALKIPARSLAARAPRAAFFTQRLHEGVGGVWALMSVVHFWELYAGLTPEDMEEMGGLFDFGSIGAALPMLVIPALALSYTEFLDLVADTFYDGDFNRAASGTSLFVRLVYQVVQLLRFGVEFSIRSGLFLLLPWIVQLLSQDHSNDPYGTQEHPVNPGWAALVEFLMPLVFMAVTTYWDDIYGPFRAGPDFELGDAANEPVDYAVLNEARPEGFSEINADTPIKGPNGLKKLFRTVSLAKHPDKISGGPSQADHEWYQNFNVAYQAALSAAKKLTAES